MPLINGQPIQNENVEYHGKILPRDAAAIAEPPFDTNVVYAGQEITKMPAPFRDPIIDYSNDPSTVLIGNYQLPYSVNISIDGEKIIAESQIIDGVSVFEHVSRKAYAIEFKMKMYVEDVKTSSFPQQILTSFWNNIWINNTVYTVTNTFLNQLHVQQIIIKSVKIQPRLGSTIVDLVIKTLENQAGQSIIIPKTAIVINF